LAKRIVRQDSLFFVLLLFSAFGHFALGYIGSSEDTTHPKVLAREQGENTVRVQLVSTVKPSVMPELPELPPQPKVLVDVDDVELPEQSEQLDSQRVVDRVALPSQHANPVYRVPEPKLQQRQNPVKPELPEDSQQTRLVRRDVQTLDIPMEQVEMVPIVEPREGNSEADLVNAGSRGAKVAPQLRAENKDPAYPPALLGRKVEGRVVLLVSVLQTGRVGKIAVHTASGQKELDAAAVAAVANWRFSPGTRGGKVQEMDVLVPVTFKIVTGNRRRK
jgi:protein TonB